MGADAAPPPCINGGIFMLKKTITSLLLISMLCVLLTGCVVTDINVKINGGDGGEIVTTLMIEKSFYGMMSGDGGVSGLDGMRQGETVIDGTEYVTFSERKSYKTYAELETALLEMTFLEMDDDEDEYEDGEPTEPARIFKSAEIKKEGWLFENRHTFTAVTNAQGADDDPDGTNFGDIYKLQLEIVMPGKIGESGGGERIHSRLICDITDLSRENTITAVSKSLNPIGVAIAVMVVALIIAVIYMLSKGAKER